MSADLLDLFFTGPDLRSHNGYTHPITNDNAPGVTTISGLINKPHLIPWAVKIAAKWAADNIDTLAQLPHEGRAGAIIEASKLVRDQPRERGSLAHWIIEQLAEGHVPDIPEYVEHQVKGWEEWWSRFVAEALHTETTVWSHTHGYAGTLDAIVRLKDGRTAIVDYKTGKDVYPEAGMQLWALRNADCIVTTRGEQPLPDIDVAVVVHLPGVTYTPLGKLSTLSNWSMREIQTGDEEGAAFLALLTVWKWEKHHARNVIGGKRT